MVSSRIAAGEQTLHSWTGHFIRLSGQSTTHQPRSLLVQNDHHCWLSVCLNSSLRVVVLMLSFSLHIYIIITYFNVTVHPMLSSHCPNLHANAKKGCRWLSSDESCRLQNRFSCFASRPELQQTPRAHVTVVHVWDASTWLIQGRCMV